LTLKEKLWADLRMRVYCRPSAFYWSGRGDLNPGPPEPH
jgi:hypothetical protein